MNVWVRIAKKPAPCFWCGKTIESGEFEVVCQYYMQMRNGRSWSKKMLFHAEPDCWMERAKAEIRSRPQIELRGRKALALSDEKKEERNRILRQRGSVMQRLNDEMFGRMRPARLRVLTDKLEELKEQIEEFGGVPESWKDKE